MNEELMTMGLVSRSKKDKGRTYRYNAYYESEGKWKFFSSAVRPHTTLDGARKGAVKELRTWSKTKVVLTDDANNELGIVMTDSRGYPIWKANGKTYNLSPETGRISPQTKHRRV